MLSHAIKWQAFYAYCALFALTAAAQRQPESLDRGVVALRKSSTQAYVGWRLLGSEPRETAFNLYRSTAGGAPVRLNAAPLTNTTDFVDTPGSALLASANSYFVRTTLGGAEGPPSAAFTLPAGAPTRQYLPIPRAAPFAGAYAAQVLYAGDVDADGAYELVGLFTYTGSGTPAEGREVIECYRLDGTFLWRVALGPNETEGNDGDGLLAVADFDGDGRADVAARTCFGTTFHDGASITVTNSQEYLSIIDGLTGQERARTGFLPALGPDPFGYWGANERPYYLYMAVACLDGVRPSFITARGIGGERLHVYAWDFRDGVLAERWHWIATAAEQMETGHSLQVFDVDNDGRDEVLFIGGALDHDGRFLYSNGLVHGDHFRVFDLDPDRPGYECFCIQQSVALGSALFDPLTGALLKKWYLSTPSDPSRADAGDVDANYRGTELWSTMPNIWTAQGNLIGPHALFPARGIWWDADLQREIWTGANSGSTAPVINKVTASHSATRLYSVYNDGVTQPYGGYPPFEGDLVGDWREEVVLDTTDHTELRVFTTSIPAANRLYALMQNPGYRVVNTCRGRCGATSPDYYLGGGMEPPPPPFAAADLVWSGSASAAWDAGGAANWLTAAGAPAAFTNGLSVRFDLTGSNAAPVQLAGALAPASVAVFSPVPYALAGSGALTGGMTLTKSGAGALTLSGAHSFTGATEVWDGALLVDGSLSQSPVTVYGGVWGGAGARGLTGGRVGGAGALGAGLALRRGAALTPGAGMGAAGALSITGALAAADGAVFAFDLSDDPSGLAKANDRAAISGSLALSGTNTVFVNLLDGRLGAGDYTLVTYSGALTSGLANLRLAGLPGVAAALAAPPGALVLHVPATRPATNVVWDGAAGARWDTAATTNWLAGGAPAVFVPGDRVSFTDAGAAHPQVTLDAAVSPAAVTVSGAASFTLQGAGALTGGGALTKVGSGTLALLTLNDYTGATCVTGGTLEVASLADAGQPSALGAAGASPTNLLLDACTFRLRAGGGGAYTDRGATLGAAGVTCEVAEAGAVLALSGVVTGRGRLTKSGPGILLLNASNTYTGGTVLAEGTLSLGNATANQFGLGTGPVTLLGGTLLMADAQASEAVAWNLIVPAGASASLRPDGRCTLTGALTGGGALAVSTPYIRTDFAGNWSSFTGALSLSGDVRVANTHGYGKAAITLDSCALYSVNTVSSGGTTLDLGALSGDSGSTLRGGPTGGRTLTWRVGGLGADAAFEGRIAEQGADTRTAVTKTGAGVWTLGGSNTYAGATTVLGGTLALSATGLLGAGDLTVSTGAVCAVSNPGGALADGAALRLNGTGRLALSDGVTDVVRQLFFDSAQQRCGAWDAARAPARFSGAGILLVTEGAPSAPASLTAAAGDGAVALAWPAVYGATHYTVWRSTVSGAGYQARVTLAATNWTDLAVVNDTTYYYVVSATNAFGAGAFSQEAAATPAEPVGDGVWTNAAGGLWSVSGNWLGAVVARGAGRTATFAPSVGVSVTQDLASCVIGRLVFTNASHTLHGGTNTLRAADAGQPLIDVAAGRTAVVYTDLAGTNGLAKTGAGTLLFSGAKSYSGGTTLREGELQLASGAALGGGALTLEAGVFRMSGANLDYLSLDNALVVPPGKTATVYLPPRVEVNGALTGATNSTLNLTVKYVRDEFNADWSGFLGQLNLTGSAADFRIDNSYGLPHARLSVGSGVKVYQIRNPSGSGTVQAVGELAGATNSALSGITTEGKYVEWLVGGLGTDSTFAGVIRNGTGTARLTKIGAGTFTLACTNIYTGATTISNGTLRVGAAHALAPGSAITLRPGATLDLNDFDAEAASLAGSGTLKVKATGTLALAGALAADLAVSAAGGGFKAGRVYTLVTCSGRPSGAYTCDLPPPWELRAANGALRLGAYTGSVLLID